MIFIYLFLFLLVFYFVFDRLTRNYVNPYKLIFIFGKKGSGKTTTLTKIALDNIRKGYKVYSTIEIPGTYLFDIREIGIRTFEPNSVVLCDEIGMVWDARDFSKFPKYVRDFFKYQRQYKLKVYLFSQTFDVDKKIRDLTDEMYLLKNVARVFSVQRRILKTICIKDAADGTSSLSEDYKFDSILFGGIKLTFIPRYVSFFKSYDPKFLEFIQGEYLDLNELQEKYIDTRKWLLDQLRLVFLALVNYPRSLWAKIMKRWKYEDSDS